ncbi:MAG: hypothetical protein SOR57_11355 [Parabacteroides sp.]|nr:hypothetical protein [Parabacteroides sp.]
MKKYIFLFIMMLFSLSAFSQNKSGILFGGGLGFEQALNMNQDHDLYKKGCQFKDRYDFDVYMGYRFRIDSRKSIFFDIDPLLRVQKLKSVDYFSPESQIESGFMTSEANDINLQISLSSTINYKIKDNFYIGLGLEPTWNVITEGKKFDIPLLGRIGYDFGKFDIAVTYRQGFFNIFDQSRFTKGRSSDINISVFIPLVY